MTEATPVVATLPLHAEDEEQKKRIIELEKVRDGHNISAMLFICKPEARGTVSATQFTSQFSRLAKLRKDDATKSMTERP